MKARQKESSRIRAANKAVAIVRLMDGQLRDWDEFLQADDAELESLPRRALKAGNFDVKRRVSKDIKNFCRSNFDGMTEDKLSDLYEDVKSKRGLEMPLTEFQQKYARIKDSALRGNPLHSTVHISIFGLGFEFPEKYLTDDIAVAVEMALHIEAQLNAWRKKNERAWLDAKADIGIAVRRHKFYSRMAILS